MTTPATATAPPALARLVGRARPDRFAGVTLGIAVLGVPPARPRDGTAALSRGEEPRQLHRILERVA
ncbi:MAG: hypothetical protein ACOZNI_15805, partial [Myxococcota bacterium]